MVKAYFEGNRKDNQKQSENEVHLAVLMTRLCMRFGYEDTNRKKKIEMVLIETKLLHHRLKSSS